MNILISIYIHTHLNTNISQNHSMAEVGRSLKRLPCPPPLLKQGYLEQIVQEHVQMAFEYVQCPRAEIPTSLGNICVPVLCIYNSVTRLYQSKNWELWQTLNKRLEIVFKCKIPAYLHWIELIYIYYVFIFLCQ